MNSPEVNGREIIRVLILEDNPVEAELIEYELEKAGFEFRLSLANNRASYLKALENSCPDIILSDYDLPSFTGAEALEIKKKHCPEIPFILVTGAVGETRAIEILTGGATDYVLKSNLSRLVPAFSRALQESREHAQRKQAEAERDALFREMEKRIQERTESLQAEIEKRRQTQEKLREAQERVRMKLESILNPTGDIGVLELADIIDSPAIQSLLDVFYLLVHLPMVIEDLRGKVLVSVGWQTICAKFHRVHPETCRHCQESDIQLSSGLRPGEFRLYKCKNHLWDMSTPIIIGGQHVGNFYTGQFIFEDETPDRELFRAQARQYGFDETEYLAAYEAVPIITRAYADTLMTFLTKLADIISRLSFSNIKLARTLAQHDLLMNSLRQSEEELSRAQSVAKTGSWRLDFRTNKLRWSDETFRIFGLPPDEPINYEKFVSMIHPADRKKVRRKWVEAEAHRESPYDIEHRIVVGSEVKWVRERAEMELDEAGNAVSGFGTVQDITDLKRTEEALTQSEEQSRAIFEFVGIGMCLTEPDTGILIQANDTFLKMTGYGRSELIGKPFLELVHPDDRRAHREDFLRLFKGEKTICEIEKRLIRKNGSIIWCLDIDVLIRDAKGCPLRVIAAVHDITERKQTEKMLQEKEERFRLAQKAGQVGIYDWDLKKDRCIMSEELTQIYELPADVQTSTRDWIQLLHPDERRRAYGNVLRAFEEKRQQIEDEYRILLKDGRIKWLTSQGNIIYNEAGEPVRMIGTSVDVTGRKQAEIALKDAEEKLRLAVESTELGTFDMNPQTYELDWSVNTKLQFGLSPDGKVDYDSFLHGLHPDDRDRIEELIRKVFQGETGGSYSAEFRTIGIGDGKLRWLAAWGRAYFDEKGRPIRFIGVTADITELKRAEQKLRQRTAELEEVNKELESFSYSVSHDLRAPLRAVKGYSGMILKEHGASMNEEMRNRFNQIVDNAVKMEQLIDDLLRFSRLGRGKLSKSEFDMAELVRESWKDIAQLNPGRDIGLTIRDLPSAFGDRNIIRQAVVNLLSNAVKFTRNREKALIEIGGFRQAEESVYFIKDNGVGFDMHYYAKLFGVFQRLHGSEYRGTGVGLAIVQRIIHRHGGRVWAESELGQGATFYFSLPAPASA